MVTVRRAVLEDAEAIARVHVDTWRTAYAGLLPAAVLAGLDVRERAETWRGLLTRWPEATHVADSGGEVVGFASAGPARGEDGAGELYAIYVLPGHWGTGAGRSLLEAAESALRMAGFPEAILWALAGNERAERFYRAAGWTQDGEKDDVLEGAEVVERRYRKSL